MAGMNRKSPKAPKTAKQGSTGGGTAAASRQSFTVPAPATAQKAKKAKNK